MRYKGLTAVAVLVVVIALVVKASLSAKKAETGKENNGEGVVWEEVGQAISGNVGDAEVAELADGRYRLYYTAAPEAGRNLEMSSSLSSDGINWTKEPGIRMEGATFPDVIKLADGRWRMYFQGAQVIQSATSVDGLSWAPEAGTRVDNQEPGFNLDTVGAQSTTRLADGRYIMVYRGTENQPYGTKKLPNKNTQMFFYATSSDGLNFEKKGLALDSRNETFEGLVDGAEWVEWDKGELRLYFWGYKGVYYSVYSQGEFSSPVLTFTKDPSKPYPPDVPCDPAVVKINGQWLMYYGQFPNGIYYAQQRKGVKI